MKNSTLIAGIVVLLAILWWLDQGDDGSDDSSDNGTTGASALFSNLTDFVTAWAHAIAPAENVNPAYNDPGGLNTQGDLGSVPALGGGVIGVFSTIDAGYQALENTLTSYVTNHGDLTLLQATSRYITGSAGNSDPSTYPQRVLNEANLVASRLGAGLQDTLASLAGGGN
jgi:hypothetical protein